MAELTRSQIVSAKLNLKDQHENGDFSAWLEGWACGWTDPVHEYSNGSEAREELLDYIKNLNERW